MTCFTPTQEKLIQIALECSRLCAMFNSNNTTDEEREWIKQRLDELDAKRSELERMLEAEGPTGENRLDAGNS